jgi:hypothetical protein
MSGGEEHIGDGFLSTREVGDPAGASVGGLFWEEEAAGDSFSFLFGNVSDKDKIKANATTANSPKTSQRCILVLLLFVESKSKQINLS